MSTAILIDERSLIDRREVRLLGLAFAFLLLACLALALSPAARMEDWSAWADRLEPLAILPVWVAGAALTHRVLSRVRPHRDPFLLPVALLLTGWGLVAVWRLAPEFGARQTGWFLVAVVILAELLRFPADLRWLRRYRYLWLVGGIALASLTLIFGTNPSGGEPRLWLGCCGLYFQPSEPLRLLLIAYLASYLADRITFGWKGSRGSLAPSLAPLLLMWGVSVALLAVQRDLGTGVLFLALFATMLFLASGRWEIVPAAISLAGVVGILGYGLVDVVRIRLQAWMSPWGDPAAGSYQVIQSLIAIASGGILGRGPGMGAPGFVPLAHSDFIFSAVCEEWGLVGGLAMLALFAILVSRGLRIAASHRDPFGAILAAGLSLAFGLQAIIILGGVLRLLPLTGITLPFVSYGGSSLVTSYIGLGFLLMLSGDRERRSRSIRPLRQTEGAVLLGLGALALATGWWSLVRGDVLTHRTDNPRWGLSERYSPRGRILDRNGQVLAETAGTAGQYYRSYPEPSAFSLIGYDSARYGQAGVERAFDAPLRGEEGYDTLTQWWTRLLSGHPPPGLDIRLTVEVSAQRAAAAALGSNAGAVVILDADTGEILALVSSPSFDPNILEDDWTELVGRSDAPLLHRPTQGVYQPGGTLAPFVLAWAMREGFASPEDPVPDVLAPVQIEGQSLECLRVPVDLENAEFAVALRSGCPGPFARLGVELGRESLLRLDEAFGLGSTPDIGLDAPPAALPEIPDEPDALELAAIGQGSLTVSPLGLARAFAALAADGELPVPRLLEAVQLPDGTWRPVVAEDAARAAVPEEVAQAIRLALDPSGGAAVGYSARALVGSEGDLVSWFLGSRRSEARTLVIVVVIEDGSPQAATRIGAQVLARGLP